MRSSGRIILSFAIPLLFVGASFFVLVRGARQAQLVPLPQEEEPLTIRPSGGPIPLDPGAELWTRVEPLDLRLYPQTARLPYGREERDLRIRAVYDDGEVAFLLEFDDATEDRDGGSSPDGCAIMLVPADAPATAQMMGHGSGANVWHWLADRDAEQHQRGSDSIQAVRTLIAAGPGTQVPMARQTVVGRGEYRDGRWRVVLKRSLASHQEGEIALEPGGTQRVSFAVWNGGAGERLASKSIAILRTLTLTR